MSDLHPTITIDGLEFRWDLEEGGLLLMGTLLIVQGWQFGSWILRLRLHADDEEATP